MLLALDVGNTDTVFGLFRGDALFFHKRIETKSLHRLPAILLNQRKLFYTPHPVIISSVIPSIDIKLKKIIEQKLHPKNILFVNHKLKLPIHLKVDSPKEVGADRIVNNCAAFHKYGGPLLVIDFGTATTLDYVDAKAQYRGGMIIPGLKIAADALFQKAARLHEIPLHVPKKMLGTNTIQQMQSGILFGYAAMIESLVCKIKKDKSKKKAMKIKVILTGGIGHLLSPLISEGHIFDPFLTLQGLCLLARINEK